ncbi:unnamed protein product [Malus baccata var. baccata]
MIYDVNSPLFRSFLSQKGGSSDKRKLEEQKPKENRPKASENKPSRLEICREKQMLFITWIQSPSFEMHTDHPES